MYQVLMPQVRMFIAYVVNSKSGVKHVNTIVALYHPKSHEMTVDPGAKQVRA